MKRVFIVYILYSAKLNKYYIGFTMHLDRRLEEHNRGKTVFTRSGIPWELIYQKSFSTRPEAVRFEKSIKKRGAGRFLKDHDIG